MADMLANIGYLILFVNLILYSIRFSDYSKAFKIFTIYCAVIFIIQILVNFLNAYNIHNLFLSHYYFIFQFIALSAFYHEILNEKIQKKFVRLGLVSVLFVLGIQYVNEPELYFNFNLFEIFITSFMLIIYAVLHFYNLLCNKKDFYYLNMGILIYLFGSTVLFLAGNLIAQLSSELNTITWTLNNFLYIIYQVFILIEWNKSFIRKNR